MPRPDYRSDWDAFIGLLSPSNGERILDIGAGDAKKAARVLEASKGAEVYAVDPNPKRVAVALRDHPAVKASVAGAERLPFPDSYFDKTYTTMALHHFADLDGALREVARTLKAGGSFIVLEVDPSSAKGRVFSLFGRLTGEHMHLMDFDHLSAKLGGAHGFRLTNSAREGSSFLFRLERT